MMETLAPQQFRYRMSGLRIHSAMALPMREDFDAALSAKADVTLLIEDVPEQLGGVLHRGANWQINQNAFLLDLPEIGRIMASGGNRISICPAPGMPPEDVLVFATGAGMSAILYQRGAMLLHASAVVRNGCAFLFCGQSGAGKSTLSAALSRNGCTFLADDLCAVVQSENGRPLVEQDGRALRLFPDSIEHLALADAVGPRVRHMIDKFHVNPPVAANDRFGTEIAAIYMLTDSRPDHGTAIDQLPPLHAAQALLRQSYRRQIALAYADRSGLAERIGAVATGTGVYHLSRPRDMNRLNETIDNLKGHWRKLGLG